MRDSFPFSDQVTQLNRLEQEQLQATMTPSSSSSSASNTMTTPTTNPSHSSSGGRDSNWTQEEVQLLVKAVTMFPAGTVRRWETVANFVNTHSSAEGSKKEKDAKMVIGKVKALQKLEAEQKEALNKQAFSRFEQQHPPKDKTKAADHSQATPSQRYGGCIDVVDCVTFEPGLSTLTILIFTLGSHVNLVQNA